MKIEKLPYALCIARLAADARIPDWCLAGLFFSVTRTSDELSVVCEQSLVPAEIRTDGDWRAFRVAGPLDFSLTGILASIAAPLAEEKISIFAVSSFDTDYVLVKARDFERALEALARVGFTVTNYSVRTE